jgi:hypothetical protein
MNGCYGGHKRKRAAAEKVMGGCIGIMRKQLKKRLAPIEGTGKGGGFDITRCFLLGSLV